MHNRQRGVFKQVAVAPLALVQGRFVLLKRRFVLTKRIFTLTQRLFRLFALCQLFLKVYKKPRILNGNGGLVRNG